MSRPSIIVSLAADEKLRRIGQLSEDRFRDDVVRPLFQLQGFKKYRDLCGVDEEGKDCVLEKDAEFGIREMFTVQTKTGKLNMSRKGNENVENAITQLRTALNASITLLNPPRSAKPDVVYLCCSGPANTAARRHILDTLRDPRLRILDGPEIVEAVDRFYPTYWLNIGYLQRCYLEAFRNYLLQLSDAMFISGRAGEAPVAPFSEEVYVAQQLFRGTTEMTVSQGQIRSHPKFEEFADSQLLTRDFKTVFVVGDGGSGKTTLLRRLALLTCDASLAATGPDGCVLPVLLRARDLIGRTDLHDCLNDSFRSLTGDEHGELSTVDIDQGRVLILVDALDELGNAESIDDLLGLLSRFRDAHQSCRIVCTSRPLFIIREYCATHKLPLYEIADFSIRQACKLVERAAAGENVNVEVASEVLRRLQDVHGMKLSPMLVTVFASTPNFQTSDIPPNIHAIFRKFAGLMLGQWDAQKGLRQQFEWDLKHRILSSVALSWQLRGFVDCDVDQFGDEVREMLRKVGQEEKADSLIEELLGSGLLIRNGTKLQFRHFLFQEYFAGSAVDTVHDVQDCANQEWWRNTIVFAFGARPDRGGELEVLLERFNSEVGEDAYVTCITVGLALQACYMTDVQVRSQLFGRVMGQLSQCFAAMSRELEQSEDHPIFSFVYQFLEARSAVSTDLVLTAEMPIVPEEDQEYLEFLRLAGAIEAGHIEQVAPEIESFNPEDKRLLLGLHLLSFFVRNLRMSTASERQTAKQVSESIKPKIRSLLDEVYKEFSGYILELRQGKVQAIDAPIATPEGQLTIPMIE